jgi:hypothetical protein
MSPPLGRGDYSDRKDSSACKIEEIMVRLNNNIRVNKN